MCTVSWIHSRDGYELFCNRDELLTRKAALPPQVVDIRGMKAIAPCDGDFGGSWISVNEVGLSLCLLNLYEASRRQEEFTSRGLLLMELADCSSREDVIGRIRKKRLGHFQPFTLLALAAAEPALIVQWNGRECLIERNGDEQMPLTSSSFNTAGVIASRKRQFGELAASANMLDANVLLDFHRSHKPSFGAYSTCMHRTDAATVSFSQINVTGDSITFRYHPKSPCSESPSGTNTEIKILPRIKR